jgi:hypothetical protein
MLYKFACATSQALRKVFERACARLANGGKVRTLTVAKRASVPDTFMALVGTMASSEPADAKADANELDTADRARTSTPLISTLLGASETTSVMALAGRVTLGLRAAMSAWSHVVMVPIHTLASTSLLTTCSPPHPNGCHTDTTSALRLRS